MIAVTGEALIDLIVQPDGRVDARLGGGPYNAARTLALLGAETSFLGRLAGDAFGRQLTAKLTEAGVTLPATPPSSAPTSLAVATLDQSGTGSYAFYLDGTSAADQDYTHLTAALPSPLDAIHIGALGLVMEPVGAATERLITTGISADTLVILDPNCRPSFIETGATISAADYRNRIKAITRRADIVKASTEDLDYLFPGASPEAAVKIMLAETGTPGTGTPGTGTPGTGMPEAPAAPRLVLVTDGPRPARAFLSATVLTQEVPAVTVADTIGAGDAFGGGFLAWWTARGLGRADLDRPDLVRSALQAAANVAALTCERPGADPPTLAEVQARGWWP